MSLVLQPDLPADEAFKSRFPVHRACRDGDVAALVSLLEQLSNQAHLTAEDSCYGWTPIHWAAHYGQLECVVHLVQRGCEVNTVSSRFNQTPTHTAAFGGHPHCVVWLSQAGADVNSQDFTGEAPIHKAARSGSLECIQVLLIAGAEPHVRNASGQTAADLAHAQGFHDCFLFISNAQNQLRQLAGLHGAPCGQSQLSRKRPQSAVDNTPTKKTKKTSGEDAEGMSIESGLDSVDDAVFTNGHAPTPPMDQNRPSSPPSANQEADMCGSLHRGGSPSSCLSQRPARWGPRGPEWGDFLHYGHFHGFGDTAEELTVRVQTENRHMKAAVDA
ncbi:ankyrin repeat domain-containing protein 10-like [Sphaeramia orbicularis]|uniref:ankyrin repeat domain-containing protein 10-like n=1 Tax=Sphaeramia orbicularis TaxID=375764 RepID=UPI00117C6D9C|nr:ankyrin repeat domain-containing protein 10-like [Sphaeramia orbicularis]